MILDIDNPFGFPSWKTGNRRLEIYCHGFGSTVFVAVHFGMCLGNRRHYFQSTFTLRYARTYWCQTFRNSKIWCLEFGCFHWKPNLLWNCFLNLTKNEIYDVNTLNSTYRVPFLSISNPRIRICFTANFSVSNIREWMPYAKKCCDDFVNHGYEKNIKFNFHMFFYTMIKLEWIEVTKWKVRIQFHFFCALLDVPCVMSMFQVFMRKLIRWLKLN